MSRIHRRSTKADLRLETLEGRITLTAGMHSHAKLLVMTVDSGYTQTGISQGQLHSLKHFDKIQNVTKAERFLFNHPKFGAWYTLNVLNRTLPTSTTPASPSGPQGPLPGHIVTGPDNQPIAIVFGAGSSGPASTPSTSDSAGSSGTTAGTATDSPSDTNGPLPGRIVTDPTGHPIAIIFGAGSSGSASTPSTSDSAGSSGTTTDSPGDSQGTLPGHIIKGPNNQPIAVVF